MYMAGIYSSDGRFAILTRAASTVMAEIHDRAPVIVSKERVFSWLKESQDAMLNAVTELFFESVHQRDEYHQQLSLFD